MSTVQLSAAAMALNQELDGGALPFHDAERAAAVTIHRFLEGPAEQLARTTGVTP